MAKTGGYGALARMRIAEAKNNSALPPITWDELWTTGYTVASGKHKAGLFETKLTDPDKERLVQVKYALETKELVVDLPDLRKFTKTLAFKLYDQLKAQRREQWIADIIKHRPANYITVQTAPQLAKLLELSIGETVIGLDTETTGLDIFGKDRVVGISISLDVADMHYYIPFRHLTGEQQLRPDTVLAALKPILEDATVGKVLHNAKFDIHMLHKDGIEVKNVCMDTMIAAHILNENEPRYALKILATKYGKHFGFPEESHSFEELFGNGGFENTPLDIGGIYACKDTHLVLAYRRWILNYFEQQPQLGDVHDLENKIIPVVVEMERNGFLVDLKYAEEYRAQLEADVAVLEQKLLQFFGDINFGSSQQLAKVLYEDMKLPKYKGDSVDASVLKMLADECEEVELLLEYRELMKLLSTYIIPLPEKVDKEGRLHGSFLQTGAATGRFSSRDPNMQNFPHDARKMIVAPKGKILVGIDLSQIEPRILAHMSGDEHFKDPYLTGKDLYSSLASRTFKVPIEECGDGSKYRKMMKTGLLATMYGTSTFTLSKQLKIPIEEAEEFINTFLETYPTVKSWIEGVHATVDEQSYVETIIGRKRRFIGHKAIAAKRGYAVDAIMRISGGDMTIMKDKERRKKIPYNISKAYWETNGDYSRVMRQSVNAIIQGSGADILKMGMVVMLDYCKAQGSDWKLVATVHDENIFEIPEDTPIEKIEELRDIMTGVITLDVPIKADVEVSLRWGEGMSLTAWKELRDAR